MPPPAEGIAYIETDGGTGSRSGAIVLSLYARVLGFDDEHRREEADRCMKMAADLAKWLQSCGVGGVFCNPFSITVVFPEPPKDFDFSLARKKGLAHVVVMPGVKQATLDAFARKYILWWRVEGRKLASLVVCIVFFNIQM
jgi:glutamate/tyrosine decarboxylase-like PLP-dependent enzyme